MQRGKGQLKKKGIPTLQGQAGQGPPPQDQKTESRQFKKGSKLPAAHTAAGAQEPDVLHKREETGPGASLRTESKRSSKSPAREPGSGTDSPAGNSKDETIQNSPPKRQARKLPSEAGTSESGSLSPKVSRIPSTKPSSTPGAASAAKDERRPSKEEVPSPRTPSKKLSKPPNLETRPGTEESGSRPESKTMSRSIRGVASGSEPPANSPKESSQSASRNVDQAPQDTPACNTGEDSGIGKSSIPAKKLSRAPTDISSKEDTQQKLIPDESLREEPREEKKQNAVEKASLEEKSEELGKTNAKESKALSQISTSDSVSSSQTQMKVENAHNPTHGSEATVQPSTPGSVSSDSGASIRSAMSTEEGKRRMSKKGSKPVVVFAPTSSDRDEDESGSTLRKSEISSEEVRKRSVRMKTLLVSAEILPEGQEVVEEEPKKELPLQPGNSQFKFLKSRCGKLVDPKTWIPLWQGYNMLETEASWKVIDEWAPTRQFILYQERLLVWSHDAPLSQHIGWDRGCWPKFYKRPITSSSWDN